MRKIPKKVVITIIIVLISIVLIASLVFSFVSKHHGEVKEGGRRAEIEVNGTIISNEISQNINQDNEVKEIENNASEVAKTEIVDGEKLAELVNMNDLFGKYYDKAKDILNTMTLEEKVGQMFLVRYPEEDANKEIKENNPGGYILFGRDFKNETSESILEKLNNNQVNSKVKMFFGVDEEGGTVVRVSEYQQFRTSKFKSPGQLFDEGGIDRIIEDSHEKTNLLKGLSLNMNLVPVADIADNQSAYIYDRTIGKSAEETAEYVRNLVKVMNEDKIISTMKHFPGYGDNIDTHTGIAVDNREYLEFEKVDFLPFKSGIEEGVPTILVNHNVVNCMDSNLPASLSDNVHRILREDLKFSGIIMTDDLAMDAVKSYVENGQAVVQAVLAGNDLIITSDFAKQKEEVLEAVKQGKITQNVINRAVIRILACKLAYNII